MCVFVGWDGVKFLISFPFELFFLFKTNFFPLLFIFIKSPKMYTTLWHFKTKIRFHSSFDLHSATDSSFYRAAIAVTINDIRVHWIKKFNYTRAYKKNWVRPTEADGKPEVSSETSNWIIWKMVINFCANKLIPSKSRRVRRICVFGVPCAVIFIWCLMAHDFTIIDSLLIAIAFASHLWACDLLERR